MTTMNTKQQLEKATGLFPLHAKQLQLPISSDRYIEQASIHFSGSLNYNTLRTAWSQLFKQHSILRTCITGIDMEKQNQQVCEKMPLPWLELDWRDVSNSEQTKKLSDFLAQDRQQRFNINKAPLLRLTFIFLANEHQHCIVSYHPIILDRESIRLLCQQLMKTYLAINNLEITNQQPEANGTADFFQYAANEFSAPSESEIYWNGYLNGSNAPTPLPITNRKASAVNTSEKCDQNQEGKSGKPLKKCKTLSKIFNRALTAHASRNHCLKSLLQGIWAILLSRYSGEYDCLFGHIVSGRPEDRKQTVLIGPFNHTVPTRITVDPQTPVLPWLQTIERNEKEQEPYQVMPVSATTTWNDSIDNNILYHSAISFETPVINNTLQQQLCDINVAVSALEFHQPTVYPLTLFIEMGDQLTIDVVYDTSLFDSDTVKRLLEHYYTLFNSIVNNPSAKISDLQLLTEQEKQKILVNWNDTYVDYPKNKCIHQLFEEQAEKTPQDIAVVFEDQRLTFEELNRKSNQLAHYLIEQGVGPDVNVGLCVERSLDMIIGLLGIIKAGGAYVPIDPEYPQQRIDYLIEDSGIVFLLTQDELNHTILNQQTTPHCCLDQIGNVVEYYSTNNPAITITPEHLVYIIYTSGSTGNPKGVAVSHGAYLNHMQWMLQTLTLSNHDKILQKTSLSFDAAAWEWSLALISGAQLVLAEPGGQRDPQYLVDMIDHHQISIFQGVPSLVNLLLEHPHRERLQSLKYLFCGGEPLSTRLCERFKATALPATLCNLYGPTEATIDASYWLYNPDKPLTTVPIGRPISNVQLYILDPQLNPIPIGITGELYIGGSGLAREYLNHPELTDERFIQHSFDGRSPTRLYRSGDLARYSLDGHIEYMGRIDDQVKVRGFRIELGEIEKKLMEHSNVHEAVVQAYRHDEDSGNHYLVAYIVCRDSPKGPFDHSVVQHTLKAQLPEYMVPNFFIRVDALPLTPNGKVDRKALPTPSVDDLVTHHYVAPRTDLERTLVKIWANVLALPIEKIGVEDSFIELGGHSLLAIRISSQVRKTLNLTISLNDIFVADTIGLLAKFIEKTPRSNDAGIPLVTVERTQPIPLSYAQQRLWFIHEFEGGTDTRYNEPLALHITGRLSPTALQQSIQTIVQRHEILHTTYQTDDGKPVQIIADARPLDIPIIETTEDNVSHYIEDHMSHVFDLNNGPLIKACILTLSYSEHILLINVHHIVCDGWSIEVLGNELSKLYEYLTSGDLSGSNFPLPPLPLQYADVSHWQQQWLTGDRCEQQLTYWKTQLSGAPALLELPTDRPRPSTPSYSGSRYSFKIPTSLTEQLRKLGRQSGTTLFMTLLAGFNILLSRYSGQGDICVGTPVANRQKPELEDLIGFFVNTLVLRTAVNSQSSAKDFLKSVKTTALAAYANQDIPFEHVVDAINPERSLSHSPLFQVMFALQDPPEAAFTLSDTTVSLIDVDTHKTKFDLTLFITNKKHELAGVVEYNTDLFDVTTIQRLCNHYVLLLNGIAEKPQKKICDLPLITEDERQQILFDWNRTNVDYPKEQCIHQLFEQQTQKTPEATAVVFENQQLTYEALNQKSNQLAHYLVEQGVRPEVRIGLCLERSFEMIIAILGVLKAGGAYVPIDPEYPQHRIDYMVNDSDINVMLTQKTVLQSLTKHKSIHYVCFDDASPITTQQKMTAPTLTVLPNNIAHVIYTSGSTGIPKGVAVPHHSISRLVINNHYLTIDRKHSLLQSASISFDAATFEIWGALLNGGQCVLYPERIPTVEKLGDVIVTNNIDILFLTTGLFNLLVDENPNILKHVKHVLTGGEAASKSHVIKAKDISPVTQIANMYGPTENTTFSTGYSVSNHDIGALSTIPIGQSISNSTTYILDQEMNPVPIGVVAELYVGGEGLAREYQGKPALTAERFIPHPFAQQPGERLYKTGDLVRHLSDGNIEFIDRIDNQVKVRGFRIELGEIESVLTQQENIREAIVLAHRSEQNTSNHYLAAYLVRDESSASTFDQTTLRAALQSQLPEYMVPNFFIVLETLPLTPNGKVDRKALPLPSDEDLLTHEYVPPRTDVEKALVDIWADILTLPVEKVGIEDNFFELGGHSLLATRVVSRIRRTLAVEMAIRDLFTANTIHTLATLVEKNLVHSPVSDDDVYPLAPVSRDKALPLSFAQQRLWFLNQFEVGETTQYNIPWALRLRGHLDIDALEKAFNALIERHESLRTTFHTVDDQAIQVIADNVTISLSTTSITEADIAAHLAAGSHHVFALSQGPLLYVALLRLSAHEHILLINMHHIISDGWSIGVFNEELTTLYSACTQNKEPTLSPLPIQYADFSHWQRQWLHGEILEQQVKYWKKQLSGAPALLELPTDKPRPATQSFHGRSLTVTLPGELTQQLHNLSRQAGATLFMTLLTGFTILLARYSGQNDICVGTPIANRQRPELEKLIGFFVNTLVLRTQIDNDTTGINLLQHVKETALSAYAHQDIPFEHLVEALQPQRSLSYPPLFQVMFALQNATQGTLELPGISVSPIQGEATTTKFDLTMSIEENSEGLLVWVDYNTDIFHHSTIERMVSHYQLLLNAMVSNPNQPVMGLPILSETEKQHLLFDWNKTDVDYPKEQCIHQLFEQQAQKTPEAIALVFENQQLTYNALNQKSNQLAHYLIEQGVAPDVCVGLCLERSFEMIIAILGILKAGGAYVPIDPQYPRQRIDYIIDHSGVASVLTHTELSNTVLDKQGIPQYCINKVLDVVKHYNPENPVAMSTPENLVYAIYTSGSTGKPKGVSINHCAYLNHMQWMQQTFTLSADDKVLHKTSLSFDAAAWEWSLPLINGSQLIIAKPEGHRDPEYLLDTIDHYQVTVFQGVPSLVSVLVEHEQSDKLKSLKYLFCGGEPLSTHLCHRFKRKKLSATLCNLYGPTETTIDTSYWIFDPDTPLTTVPIGRPINNAQIYLLDTQLNPVPVGVVGELYIGGAGLAREYLHHDDLTKAKFIQHSFDEQSHTRLYRSGDLARYLPDGNIEFVGRIDDQVKVRGFRIELGEIENALMEQDDIRDAIVVAYSHKGDNTHSDYLTAYLVRDKQSQGAFNHVALQAVLKAQLPDYMIPNLFICLDSLPLTPNGKVDQKALPRPNASDLLTRRYVAPRTEIEKSFVTIWANILKLPNDKVGIDDNFFELGGHSLLATQLITPLRKICKQEIPLRALFDYPTIAGLVTAIESDVIASDSTTLVDLKKEAILHPSICVASAKYPSAQTPGSIFLTGATGFIGRFLLCELLQQTSAKIICLVRGKKDKQQAFARLKANLVTNRLWRANYASRIDVVVGDIGQPSLGLCEADFTSLAEHIDVIYHNATAMNHIASYHALKTETVGGIQEILRLACTHKLKPVHYCSTISIFSQTYSRNTQDNPGRYERTVNEWSSIDHEQHKVTDGYTSSKWVAEKLVMLAQAKGVPCCIYRFGLITGDTQQGRYDADQWLYRLISSSIHLGCYPIDYCPAIGLLPVDIAAKSLVSLSRQTQQNTSNDPVQNVFHLNNPNTVGIHQFFEIYNQTWGDDRPLEALVFEQWVQKVKQFVDNEGDHFASSDTARNVSIYPLMLQYADTGDADHSDTDDHSVTHVQSQLTQQILQQRGLSFPVIDRSLIKVYLQFITGRSNESPRSLKLGR